MWNVTIRDTGVQNEAITIQVEFTKGEESIVRNFAGNTKEELDSKIARQLETLEKRDANIPLVKAGSWTPVVTEKTPEDLEKEAFEAAKAEWLQKKAALATMIEDMQKGRELGITPDETQVSIMQGLATWVNENMRQEYYF